MPIPQTDEERANLLDDWIAALRSGRYEQTRKTLRDDTGFCCLGVLVDVMDPDGWLQHPGRTRVYVQKCVCDEEAENPYGNGEDGESLLADSPFPGMDTEGLIVGKNTPLFELNDKDGWAFDKIADLIEQEREAILKGKVI